MSDTAHNKRICFHYQGIQISGTLTQGTIYSYSKKAVYDQLHHQGITPISIKKQQHSLFSKKIPKIYLIEFVQQLTILLNAEVLLTTALNMLANTSHKSLIHFINEIKQQIEQGSSLANALKSHSQNFNTIDCELINAGEESGTLPQLLNQLATYKAEEFKLTKKLKRAVSYPLFVLTVGITMTIALAIFVVPQFQHFFSAFSADLPAYTQAVITLMQYTKQYAPLSVILSILLYVSMRLLARYSIKVRYTLHWIILLLPIAGPLILNLTLGRCARVLATTLKAGIPLPQALQLSQNIISNAVISKNYHAANHAVIAGHAFSSALSQYKIFPQRMIQMITVGEQSGKLSIMLEYIATLHQVEAKKTLDYICSLLEPAIMLTLALLMGSLIIAMYLPIFKLGTII